jgi:hypothetical protein
MTSLQWERRFGHSLSASRGLEEIYIITEYVTLHSTLPEGRSHQEINSVFYSPTPDYSHASSPSNVMTLIDRDRGVTSLQESTVTVVHFCEQFSRCHSVE